MSSMVIEDITTKIKLKESRNQFENQVLILASPFDRIAAFVVDTFIILSPFVSLVWSLMVNNLNEIEQTQLSYKLEPLIAKYVAFIVLIFLGYHSFFISRFGATPGKKIFNLKVINFWDRKTPSFTTSLFRTFMLLIELVMLCIPLISLLSLNKKRALHDRITETVLISTDPTKYKMPHPLELNFAKAMYISFILVYSLLIGVQFARGGFKLQKDTVELSSTESCQEKELTEESFTQVILNYLSENESKTCLSKWTQKALRQKQTKELAFFAKYLLSSSDFTSESLKRKYMNHFCNSNSTICQISKFQHEKSQDILTENLFNDLHEKKNSLYLSWLLTIALERNSYKLIDELIARYQFPNEFLPYTEYTKAIASWAKKDMEQTRKIASSFYQNQSERAYGLSSWVCYHSLINSCAYVKEESCDYFSKNYKTSSSSTVQDELAFVRYKECQEGDDLNYGEIVNNVLSEEAKELLQGANLKQSKINSKAALQYLRVLLSPDLTEIAKGDAALRLMDISKDDKTLTQIFNWWSSTEKTNLWETVGIQLLTIEIENTSFTQAHKIAEILMNETTPTYETKKNILLSYYYSGFEEKAYEMLHSLHEGHAREPAQNDTDFLKVTHYLERKFKK